MRTSRPILGTDRDAELRRRVGGVKRGAEARAARAEDQDVGLGGVDHPASSAMIRARPHGTSRPLSYRGSSAGFRAPALRAQADRG